MRVVRDSKLMNLERPEGELRTGERTIHAKLPTT